MAHDDETTTINKPDGRFTILIHTFYATGHVLPAQAVAAALVRRGHRVVWLTHPEQASRVRASGAEFVPTEAVAAADAVLAGPAPTTLAGMVELLFGRRLAAQAADLRRALAGLAAAGAAGATEGGGADLVLHDAMPYGAAALHELGEAPPWATLGVVPLYEFGDAASTNVGAILTAPDLLLPCLNAQRAALGPLGPLRASDPVHYSPRLHLQASCPSLELGRARPNLHYVGPLVMAKGEEGGDEASSSLPGWWADVEAHPCVVGITQGTYSVDPANLLVPALEALGRDDDDDDDDDDDGDGESLLLVVPTPHAGAVREGLARRGLAAAPGNARLAAWVPYDRLLPRCRVLVTNGGYGSVTQALAHGVPLVCAGTSEDKKDTAERVARLGAGVDLGTDSPSPAMIRDAVREVLGDGRYRARAERIAEELGGLGGAERACDLLEEVMREGCRVRGG